MFFPPFFEAFSAPSLRQRYLQLHPEAADAAAAAGAVAPPSVTATELTEADQADQADHEESNEESTVADVADWKHAQNEETKPKTCLNTFENLRKLEKSLQQGEADMG